LGASKARLTRQLLTESILLSSAGAALGLFLTKPAVTLLARFAERFTTRAAEVKVDGPVLLFAFLVALGSGVLFGLAPAFTTSRFAGEALSRGTSRTATSRRQRLRGFLVVAQVAVSFLLLIGAGLTLRSLWKLERVNAGFNPDRLLTLRVTPSFTRYNDPAKLTTLTHNILRRVSNLGASQSAALASNFPFNPSGIVSGPGTVAFEVEGKPVSKGELAPIVDTTYVSPGYFTAIRQSILTGRDFSEHDHTQAQPVAIINQTMARHRWPNEDAVGKRVSFDNGKTWVKIVGVAGDVKEYGLDRPMGDELYQPVDQTGFANRLIVRTSVDPMTLAPLVRAALRDVDPQLGIDQVATIEGLKEESFASPRVIAALLALFAALATVISAGGIGAALALSVTQRRQELGIRMALGAQAQSIVRMVIRQGLALTVAGTLLGIAGAIALTRLLRGLLYATSPTDALTFFCVSLLFLLVAAAACFIPARQVTRIDPVIALREE
jgi:predicted permease